MSSKTKEQLELELKEATRLVERLVDDHCSFFDLRKGGWVGGKYELESCREAMSRMQGVPHPGCPNCEARAFLAKGR